jgi:hypothetical protein
MAFAMRKFVGDKSSIEARTDDGKRWNMTVFDRGHVTKYEDATEAEVNDLAAKKHMKLERKV